MAERKKITDDELLALTANEIRQSVGYRTGKLSESRRKSLQYYLARPVGDLAPPEVEGRSNVVATDVADTIEGMMPFLLKVFAGGDNAVEFVASKEGDEAAARQATNYLNYLFFRRNPGYEIFQTWFKDALLQKVGVVKIWWHAELVESRETYDGLTDHEMATLLQDDEVEAIEHSAKDDPAAVRQREDMLAQMQEQMGQVQQQCAELRRAAMMDPRAAPQLQQCEQQLAMMGQQFQAAKAQPVPQVHDLVVKRKADKSRVMVENVPPEEFLISRESKSIATARFVCHQRLWTISDLKAEGYTNVDNIQNDDTMAAFSPERVERQTWNDEQGWMAGVGQNPGDPTQRMVWVSECYIRADVDGDGISEWRKVTRAGNTILDNEECDGPPFVSICPIPLPHQFYGLSIADVAMEVQKQRTAVLRGVLDNMYLQVNGRYFAVDNQVNLDDLLTSRPGGVVRVKQPGAVGRLDQGMSDAGGAYQMLEYLDQLRESRTGFTRYSQGSDADSLNKTATGIDIITTRSDERLELTARNFAETGVKDLFRMMLKLVCQHQQKAAVIAVSGAWVEVDPREWRNQFELEINVGLGSGNKDAQVSRVQALMAAQLQLGPFGLVNPQNQYAAAQKFTSLLGFKAPEMYWQDPQKAPPPPPPPPPQDPAIQVATIKANADMQLKQLERQAAQEGTQLEMAQEQARVQAQAEKDRMDKQQEAELARFKVQIEAQAAIQIAQVKAQGEIDKAVAVERIRIEAAGITENAEARTAQTEGLLAQVNDSMQQLGQLVEALAGEHVRKQSARFVRDANGRLVGAVDAQGAPIATLERDEQGRAIGLAGQ